MAFASRQLPILGTSITPGPFGLNGSPNPSGTFPVAPFRPPIAPPRSVSRFHYLEPSRLRQKPFKPWKKVESKYKAQGIDYDVVGPFEDATAALSEGEFNWAAVIGVDPFLGAFDEVGFIQNVQSNSVQLTYASGDSDLNPIAVKVVLDVPIRDHDPSAAGQNFPWVSRTRFRSVGPVGGNIEIVQFDSPGIRRLPGRHPKAFEKRLIRVEECLMFNTWLATRPASSDPKDLKSYEFIRSLTWWINRTVRITWPKSSFAPIECKASGPGLICDPIKPGTGTMTPVLVEPDAWDHRRLEPPLF